MNLEIAHLNYGFTPCAVKPSESIPLPAQFDFDDVEGCARKIFALMSNASGGFLLRDCRVRIHRERKTANLTANGAHVYYADKSLPKLDVEQAIQLMADSEVLDLGSVRTDEYGDGWQRAKWYPVGTSNEVMGVSG